MEITAGKIAATGAQASFAATFFALTRYFCFLPAKAIPSVESWQTEVKADYYNYAITFYFPRGICLLSNFCTKA